MAFFTQRRWFETDPNSLHLDGSNQSSWTPTSTLVSNLNADLLDGIHASGFLKLDQTTPQTVTAGAPIFSSGLNFAASPNAYYILPPTGFTGSVTLTLPSTDGSPNQQLTTDGSGNLSWATVAPDLSGYVPYTGATGDVDLGVHTLTTARLSFDLTNYIEWGDPILYITSEGPINLSAGGEVFSGAGVDLGSVAAPWGDIYGYKNLYLPTGNAVFGHNYGITGGGASTTLKITNFGADDPGNVIIDADNVTFDSTGAYGNAVVFNKGLTSLSGITTDTINATSYVITPSLRGYTTATDGLKISGPAGTTDVVMRVDTQTNRVYIGGDSAPSARLELIAGSTTIGPFRLNGGPVLSSPLAGMVEMGTGAGAQDELYFTISTGAARKTILLNDGTRLTSGRIPRVTTNGRLTDSANLTYDGSAYILIGSSTSTVTEINRAVAGQTADIEQWQDSASNVVAHVGVDGHISASGTDQSTITKGLKLNTGGGTALTDSFTANGYNYKVTTQTTTYAALPVDDVIVCNSAAGFTVSLPAASGTGKVYTIKSINTGAIVVDGDSGDLIDGETTQTIYQWDSIVVCDYSNNNWVII